MIKTEIIVENMKKQVDDIEARVTGALAKLSEDTETWKGEIEALQENSANLITLQEKAKSELDKNIQAVKDLLGNLSYFPYYTFIKL
jgi:SMC interacting uncharacterized protein involved in chromosome segregation